jgi:hypothetical protein
MSIRAKRKQPFIPAKASVRAATEPPTKPDALTTTVHYTCQHDGRVKAGPKPPVQALLIPPMNTAFTGTWRLSKRRRAVIIADPARLS